MEKIIGKEKSVNDLLARKKYTIHYYQREYRWGKKQIEELIDDLTEEFLVYYKVEHNRTDGAKYGHYFLGSVVITSDDSKRAIIDGQQRLTSLTLLLIYLENLQKSRLENEKVSINDLIFSDEYGLKSFNISVEEREKCLNSLYTQQNGFYLTEEPESVQNIYARYKDIEEIFPEDLKEKALTFFIEWLIKKVYLVEITAYTEQDAHKIFVSMNDRGLSLTPTEMLKGYLLSEIKDDAKRHEANELWKKQILALKDLDVNSKEEDADFIKNWLRAQYASTIRETKSGAEKKDFDLIGTEFHKWVRENAKNIGLSRTEDYEDFVLKEFKLFSDIYIRLKNYSRHFHKEYEYVYYNANRNFTFQYQLILSTIARTDTFDEINRKIKVTAAFIDQYIAIKVFNFRVVDYSTIKNAIFNITRSIRQTTVINLASKLEKELKETGLSLENIDHFFLNQFTARYMLHILARMSYFIESSCGLLTTRFEDYVNRSSKNPFDIEHIWADKISQHNDEFKTNEEDEFQTHRNKFGALLILPRDKNRSFKDKSYEKKLPMYFGENLLAKSLDNKCYVNNPQFRKFITTNSLHFQHHNQFKKKDIFDRQQLYKAIAKQIWNTQILYDLTKE